jgi:hypothetical protein
MNAWYSLILPFLIHLVIFLHGISETLTAGAKGAQYLSSPRISEVRQREKEWEMMGAARRSGAQSANQMRYNLMMERQMQQARRQTQRILF